MERHHPTKAQNHDVVFGQFLTSTFALFVSPDDSLQRHQVTERFRTTKIFSRSIAIFFNGEEQTDCETVEQQINDVSLSLQVSCVWVVKTFMNNPGLAAGVQCEGEEYGTSEIL